MITVVDGTLTVTARKIKVIANPNSVVYGGEAEAAGVTFSYVFTGDTVIADLAIVTYTFNTKADGTGTAYAPGSPVNGTYYIIPAISAENLANVNSNYEIEAYEAGALTVEKKTVTVTANDGFITYGKELPVAGFGFTVTPELFGNDKFEVSYSSSDYIPGTSKVGDKCIIKVNVVETDISKNYDITTVDGEFEVQVCVIEVSIDLDKIKYTYGSSVELKGKISVPEAFKDVVLGTAVFSVENAKDVDVYEVKVNGITLSDEDNYDLTFVGETTIEITPLKITIKPDDIALTYGDAAPAYTWEGCKSLIPYDADITEFTQKLVISSEYVAGETVSGEYVINIAFDEDYENGNYKVSFEPAKLTVAKKQIKFTVEDAWTYYGNAEPEYNIVCNEFVGDDNFENSFIGQIIIDAEGYTIGFDAGTYEVSVNCTYLESDKYEVTYTGSTELEVRKRPVTITPDTFGITYGDPIPTYTYTIGGEGLALDHTMNDLGKISYVCTYGKGNAVGTYEIKITFTAYETYKNNYVVTYSDVGTLTVAPKALVITPKDVTILVGTTPEPVIEFTYSGALAGDSISFKGALGREEGTAIKAYNITLGTLEVFNPNYTLVLDPDSTAKFNIVGLTISNVSLTLGFRDEIFMNYYFDIKNVGNVKLEDYGIIQWTEAQYNALGGNYEMNGNEAYVLPAIFEAVYDENGFGYNLKANGQAIAAPYYNDTYYARAYVKLEGGAYVYGNIIEYSVVDYAKVMIEGDYGAEIKVLMIALLDYGTAAQVYFNPTTDKKEYANAFINEDIREACGAMTIEDVNTPEIDTSLKTVEDVTYDANLNWTVGSATFDGAFKLNFYGIAVDDKYTAENFGITYWTEDMIEDGKFDYTKGVTLMLGETMVNKYGEEGIKFKTSSIGYVFSVDDIAAAEGTERYYVAMFTVDAEGDRSYGRVTFLSIADYAYLATQNTEDADIVLVGKSVLVYLAAADAYKKATPDWQ